MAEQGSNGEEIEILTPDELRDTGIAIPEFNGVTIWHNDLVCGFCLGPVEIHVYLLQWEKRSAVHLMCENCFRKMATSSFDVATE